MPESADATSSAKSTTKGSTPTVATTEDLAKSIKYLAQSAKWARNTRKAGFTNLTTEQGTELDKTLREAQTQMHALSKTLDEWAKKNNWTRPSKTGDSSAGDKETTETKTEGTDDEKSEAKSETKSEGE
ncbi:hypothetical protein L202_06202 [Cryptococcus amylolentus CBS 6039]|uniref:Uncharacterized protein n=1 Tax=Cryptococcus amylolentus CBS 6039 TaxID=1295533 RepID=A0A1E3HIV9_9TREE|nr:hypothetical protein L202_06202 [Cryptococcus amylolentus CBS 6039]ODN76274.1 hypothetical protein L202_06202 [Cryptococcus amylolentus CBS 6039]